MPVDFCKVSLLVPRLKQIEEPLVLLEKGFLALVHVLELTNAKQSFCGESGEHFFKPWTTGCCHDRLVEFQV
jgi:hypothetical protein